MSIRSVSALALALVLGLGLAACDAGGEREEAEEGVVGGQEEAEDD